MASKRTPQQKSSRPTPAKINERALKGVVGGTLKKAKKKD